MKSNKIYTTKFTGNHAVKKTIISHSYQPLISFLEATDNSLLNWKPPIKIINQNSFFTALQIIPWGTTLNAKSKFFFIKVFIITVRHNVTFHFMKSYSEFCGNHHIKVGETFSKNIVVLGSNLVNLVNPCQFIKIFVTYWLIYQYF